MKTNHILRKSLVVIVLALGTMMFAMYPSRPIRHTENKTIASEASNQTPTEHEGDNASTSQAFSYSLGKAKLVGEEGAMGKEAELRINGIDDDLPPLNMGMVNVTGEHSGFRMLPHGTRFNKDIAIVLPYDSLLIPLGYTPADIRTYYYNETESTWLMVELDKIDVDNQCVVSKVNHFTDFINAIIKTPEVSETAAFVPTIQQQTIWAVRTFRILSTFPTGVPECSLNYRLPITTTAEAVGWAKDGTSRCRAYPSTHDGACLGLTTVKRAKSTCLTGSSLSQEIRMAFFSHCLTKENGRTAIKVLSDSICVWKAVSRKSCVMATLPKAIIGK